MKTKTLAAALLVSTMAMACKNPVPEFNLVGNDGKSYEANHLVSKPSLVFFLKLDCPMNPKQIPALNDIQKQFGSSAQVVAFVNADAKTTAAYGKKLGTKFLLLADADGKVIEKFGATNSLDSTLVATKDAPRFPKIWKGISQKQLAEEVDIIVKHGHKLPTVSYKLAPAEARSGCSF